jgi:DNA-binding transcriptional regulator/RsmH inhibitor MraZ
MLAQLFAGFLTVKRSRNRIRIPMVWRQPGGWSGSSLLVVADPEGFCLMVFPAKRIRFRLRELADGERAEHGPAAPKLVHKIVKIDSAGCFPIPRELLSLLDPEGDVLLLGAGERFEIWSPSRRAAYKKTEGVMKLEQEIMDIARSLGF